MRCLHTLLFSLPTLFELSIPAGPLLDSSELRACTVKERTQSKDTANGNVAASVVADTATAGSAVALRTLGTDGGATESDPAIDERLQGPDY